MTFHDDTETHPIDYKEPKSTEIKLECSDYNNTVNIENDNDNALSIDQDQTKLKESCDKKISNFVNEINSEDNLSCDLFVVIKTFIRVQLM